MKRHSPAIAARQTQEKTLLLEQLKKTPIIQIACEKLGIGRASFYRWKKEDPDFARRADEALQEGILLMNDMAESQLLSKIRDGELPAIMFWLRSRHQAYGSKVELKTTLERRHVLTPEQEALIKRALQFASLAPPLPPSSDGHHDS